MHCEVKSYHIPGQEQADKQPPIIWKLEYDVSSAARFECMKNPIRHRRLYRCHIDLTKESEKKIRAFDRGQRMFNAELRWCAYKVIEKMQKLRIQTENVNKILKMKYSYDSDIQYKQVLPKKRTRCLVKEGNRRPDGLKVIRNISFFTTAEEESVESLCDEDVVKVRPK